MLELLREVPGLDQLQQRQLHQLLARATEQANHGVVHSQETAIHRIGQRHPGGRAVEALPEHRLELAAGALGRLQIGHIQGRPAQHERSVVPSHRLRSSNDIPDHPVHAVGS